MSKLKKFAASFKTRSLRVGGYSVVATAMVLAIVIGANLLVGALPKAYTQWDMTANQLYSLSGLTQDLLKGLQSDVTVYWVCQSGVEDTSLQILLERYASFSKHFRLEKLDPDLNPTFVQKYSDISFTNNSLLVMGQERYRYVDNEDIYREEMDYNTYEYVYTFDGENALTSAIDYVTAADLPKIYTLSGHQEVLVEDDFKRALELENFLMVDLNLSAAQAVPEDADMVMILAPFTDLTQAEAASLTAYLETGGDLLLLSMPTQDAAYPNLYGVLEAYGVSAVPGVVFEGSTTNTYYSYPHYLVPNIQAHSITQPLTDGNYGLMIPEAHGLTIASQLPENTTVTSLLETSGQAYAKLGAWPLEVTDKEAGDLEGPFSLAVAIEQKVSETKSTKIIWVSSVQLLSGSINSAISGGNLNLFMNSVNWAGDYTQRISIRAKNQDVSYLNINSASAATLNVLLVAVIPLCVLALGVFVFVRRKSK